MPPLFAAKENPSLNIVAFFAQSYWVTRTLVKQKDRPTFVRFVADGIKLGWEASVKDHYGFATLNELESDLLAKLKAARKGEANKPPAPPGVASLVMATADEIGRMLIGSPNIEYKPVTTCVPRQNTVMQDGKPRQQTYFQPITSYQLDRKSVRTYGVDELKVTTADGKPIEPAKLLETLKARPTAVVFTPDGMPLDKQFADVLKPGTIVLVPVVKAPPPVNMPPQIAR